MAASADVPSHQKDTGMVTLYKITDRHGKCDDGLTWSQGQTIIPTRKDPSKIDFDAELVVGYADPLLASFFAPRHCDALEGWRLWEAEGNSEGRTFTGIKCGPVNVIRECQFPLLSLRQRLRFAGMMALATCETEAWRLWATNWLLGASFSPTHAKLAKEAAQASAMAAQHEDRNAQQQWLSAYNMNRPTQLFSSELGLPRAAARWAMRWKLTVAESTSEAKYAAANAAAWTSSAIIPYEAADVRNRQMAQEVLNGVATMTSTGGLAERAKVAFRRLSSARNIVESIREALGWSETAIRVRHYAMVTNAEMPFRLEHPKRKKLDRHCEEAIAAASKASAVNIEEIARRVVHGNS